MPLELDASSSRSTALTTLGKFLRFKIESDVAEIKTIQTDAARTSISGSEPVLIK